MNCEDILPDFLERCRKCENSRECQLFYMVRKFVEILKICQQDTSPRSS